MSEKVKGCFYIEDKLKSIDISKETEERVYKKAFDKRVVVAQIYKDAYYWARGRARGELTEDILNEYLDMSVAAVQRKNEKERGLDLV